MMTPDSDSKVVDSEQCINFQEDIFDIEYSPLKLNQILHRQSPGIHAASH